MQYDDSHASSSTLFGASQSGGTGMWFIQLRVLTTNAPKKIDQHPFHGFTQYDGTSYGYPYDQDRDQLYNSLSLSNPQPNFSQPHDDGTSHDRYPYDQDQFGDTGDQSYDGSSLINPQPNLSQPQGDGISYDRYAYDQDRFEDSGDQLYDCLALTMPGDPQEDTHVHGTPLPPWVSEAPDGGVGVIDRGTSFIPPATNLSLIWWGEIPQEEVIHVSLLFIVLP
jgi:hypothetical protein